MQQPADLETPLPSGGDDTKTAHDKAVRDLNEWHTTQSCFGCDVTYSRRPSEWADQDWQDLYSLYRTEKHPRRKQILGSALDSYSFNADMCGSMIFVCVCAVLAVIFIWSTVPTIPPRTCNYHNVPGAVEELRELKNKLYDLWDNTTRWLEGYPPN